MVSGEKAGESVEKEKALASILCSGCTGFCTVWRLFKIRANPLHGVGDQADKCWELVELRQSLPVCCNIWLKVQVKIGQVGKLDRLQVYVEEPIWNGIYDG